MILRAYPEESVTYVVRDEIYKAELAGLERIDGGRFVAILRKVEFEITSTDGYPEGSVGVYMNLVDLFPSQDWEQVIINLEKSDPGKSSDALRHIQSQRIYQRFGVAIVYTVIRCDFGCIIVLQAISVYDGAASDFLNKLVRTY